MSTAAPWEDPARVAALGRVAVLCGGASAEREISLRSGAAVHAALAESRVDCLQIDTREALLSQLEDTRPDKAFIALHGRGGEDGTVQGLLQLAGIPYTGSGVLGSALAMDKWRSKMIWQSCGLPTPRGVLLEADTDWQAVGEQLGFPIFVKPVHEGSSIGMSRAVDAEQLQQAWQDAAQYDALVLAERFVDGSEYTVGILGGEALPTLRLETPCEFYDYEAKYSRNDTRYLHPCGLSDAENDSLAQLALKAFAALGCSGWGRVDVMRDADGSFQLLEVNTVPGLTDHSLVPMAARHAGIDFPELILRILFEMEGSE